MGEKEQPIPPEYEQKEIAELPTDSPNERLVRVEESGPGAEEAAQQIENSVTQTEQEIGLVRAGLNLPKPAEEDSSVRAGRAQVEALRREAETGPKIEMRKFEGAIGQLRSLSRELRARDNDRFNEIIPQENIGRLSASINNLEDALQKPNQNLEEINNALNKISATLESAQDVPRPRQLRDDYDSLRKTSFHIRGVGEESVAIRRSLGGREDKELEGTLRALARVQKVTEQLYNYTAKKAQMLRDMGR